MPYRKFEGLIVPEAEREKTLRRVLADSAELDRVVEHCPQRRVAVQAGAYVGIWSKKLAEHFDTVYAFEPDPESFCSFAWNTRDLPNIVRIQAAVGCERRLVDLVRTPTVAARSYAGAKGRLPTLRIDDLCLEICDLIYLDTEGSEYRGLLGARETIKRCHPVIGIEDQSIKKPQGLGERWFGEEPGAAARLLEGKGYRVVGQIGQVDLLFAPQ